MMKNREREILGHYKKGEALPLLYFRTSEQKH